MLSRAILVVFVICGTVWAEEGISVTRIFGPEQPGAYKHPAAFDELANGDLYVAYYCGSGEYGDDTMVYGARLPEGKKKWTKPEVIADSPYRSEGNPVIWQSAEGTVWLFYVVRYGETWSSSRIQAKLSFDGAKTWSDPMIVAWDPGMMVRNQPLEKPGGFILPVYHETGEDTEVVGAGTSSLFLHFDNKTKQFTASNKVYSRVGNLQPAVARIDGDHLVAYCRRGGGYEPITDGWMVRTESHDGGMTWSPGEETDFQNPNAAVDFIKLQNGHLLLVFNDNMNDRTPLTVAISTDNDKSYPHRKNIMEGAGPFAYPYAIQTQDGKIHIIFTSNERTAIYHAVFEEDFILK